MEDTTGGLRQAVLMALFCRGVWILREPHLFLALVSDNLGSSALEVRILNRVVELGCLERFADAADAVTPQALRDAAEMTANLLEVEFAVRTDVARSISLDIALGISDFLGIEAPVMPPGWASGVTYPRTLQTRDWDGPRTVTVYAPPPHMSTVYGSPSIIGGVLGSIANLFSKKGGR